MNFEELFGIYGTIINIIGNTAGFGEKALLEKKVSKAVRGATIIANEFVECIIIMRKSFL